ncbi:MAG: TolC family protein [Gemmatimonadota bacterium]
MRTLEKPDRGGRKRKSGVRAGVVLWALMLAWPGVVRAQSMQTAARVQQAAGDTVALSLDAALTRALGQSEEVRLAEAQVDAASAQVHVARSAALPQVNGSFGYTRTFASIFDTGQSFSIPDSLQFKPDPNAPIDQRVTYLEDHVQMAAYASLGQLFSNLPFAQVNLYNAGVTGSQVLFAGGRVTAGIRAAQDAAQAADYQLQEQRAQTAYDVKQAYYQAVLASESAQIAAEAVTQAQDFLSQEQLRRRAGRASDLDVLRAQVDLENLKPQEVQARNGAELARLNLKRLVDLPLSTPLRLTTSLELGSDPGPQARLADASAIVDRRSAVLAAERGLAAREQQVRVAKAAFLPSVALSMSYAKQTYPPGMFDFSAPWRTDWTGSVAVQLPVFNGGQRIANLQSARAQADQARLQLAQLRESVELQYRQAVGEEQRAWAQIAARRRTVEQAQKVYDLTVLQHDQGLATSLEVSSARLGLRQARTNLAQALADYHTAKAAVVRALGSSGAPAREGGE